MNLVGEGLVGRCFLGFCFLFFLGGFLAILVGFFFGVLLRRLFLG